MGNDRSRRRRAALKVILLTLLATAVAAFAAVLILGAAGWGCFVGFAFGSSEPCGPGWAITVLAFLPALAILAGGLLWARRVGAPEPVAPQRVWLVAAPGVDLKLDPRQDQLVAHLEAGALVKEVRRLYQHVRVITPDGLEDWVGADRLEPTDRGEGGGDG